VQWALRPEEFDQAAFDEQLLKRLKEPPEALDPDYTDFTAQ